MAQSYRYLAEWFELLNDDCDYLKWSQYFIDGLKKYGCGEGKKGLELGCGSGVFCRALALKGYRMSGADNSEEMLSVAERRAREAGAHCSFFLADACNLRAPEKYDFLLAPNDVFNYVPQKKLKTAFHSLSKCLEKDGLFWFDLSSEHKLLKKVADTVSVDDREEVTYLSFNRREENAVRMEVTLFVKRKDGAFDRLDETHTLFLHSKEETARALEEAGFELLSLEGEFGSDAEHADRWNFICRKHR